MSKHHHNFGIKAITWAFLFKNINVSVITISLFNSDDILFKF